MAKFTYSVVIPSWNGINHLKINFPQIFKLPVNEFIIIDDHSPQNDYRYIQKHFPTVNVMRNEKNFGFGTTVNRGVALATTDIVILLNLDAVPALDILNYLDDDFKNPEVFAVSLSESQFGPTEQTFSQGYITHRPILPRPTTVTKTMWVSGGSGAFRKKYWDQLQGLDSIYDPFYWEDIDICTRATHRGWINLWDPDACVQHEHEKTIGVYIDKNYKTKIQERNHLLFTWKFLSISQWTIHLFFLFFRLIKHPGYFRIVFHALTRKIKH